MNGRLLSHSLGLLGVAALLAGAAAVPRYRVTGAIAAAGDGGWDYASIDPRTHRLFMAHGEAVTQIDLTQANRVRSFGRIDHGHAVVPVRGGEVLAVTSGHDATVRLIDVPSGRELASLPVGADPDAALIDPATGHLLTMNAQAGSVSEIDVAARRVVRTIPVKPALEYAAIGRGRTLYINDEDANEVEVVDLATGTVGAPITMPGCEGPTGLAFDAAHDRLVSACANGKAAIVDAAARRLVQLVPIGAGPDAVLLDTRRGVALIPCGRDGVLDVLSVRGPGPVTRIAEVKTERGARTGALDAATGTVYLPTARFGPPTAPGKRPPVLPGSFHILVVKPA